MLVTPIPVLDVTKDDGGPVPRMRFWGHNWECLNAQHFLLERNWGMVLEEQVAFESAPPYSFFPPENQRMMWALSRSLMCLATKQYVECLAGTSRPHGVITCTFLSRFVLLDTVQVFVGVNA